LCKQKRESTKLDYIVYAGNILLRSEIPNFKLTHNKTNFQPI